MACIVMAQPVGRPRDAGSDPNCYVVMAYTIMASVVMAYVVMAYIVMAQSVGHP